MEPRTMSLDALSELHKAHAKQPLDLDLFTLIAYAERVLPDQSVGHAVFSSTAVAKEPITVVLPQLVDLFLNGDDTFIIDKATEAYARVLHEAAMRCHFNDVNLTPWEYSDLQTLTIEQHLKKAGIPLDKCVELKG